jgi:hypothetical protein
MCIDIQYRTTALALWATALVQAQPKAVMKEKEKKV